MYTVELQYKWECREMRFLLFYTPDNHLKELNLGQADLAPPMFPLSHLKNVGDLPHWKKGVIVTY